MNKPFLTIEQLIDLLNTKGVVPGQNAADVLRRENYYAVVNGYKDPFLLSDDPSRFLSGITFDSIYELFAMDRRLRAITFRYIVFAEALFKNVCCRAFCSRHIEAPEAYLDINSYRLDAQVPNKAQRLIDDFNKILNRPRSGRPRKKYLAHYEEIHGEVPLWVLMNALTLGQASKFSCFLDDSLPFAISTEIENLYLHYHGVRIRLNSKRLANAVNVVREFRNLCAHDERLYCSRVGRQNAGFADFVRLIEPLLTPKQYVLFRRDVYGCVRESCARIALIGEERVFSMMGFSDVVEAKG